MDTSSLRYLPAIVCAEYDSPIDALLGRHVVHDEAMDRVTAAWQDGTVSCVVVTVDGGRTVAAILLSNGRWAACNAFPEHACASRYDANGC